MSSHAGVHCTDGSCGSPKPLPLPGQRVGRGGTGLPTVPGLRGAFQRPTGCIGQRLSDVQEMTGSSGRQAARIYHHSFDMIRFESAAEFNTKVQTNCWHNYRQCNRDSPCLFSLVSGPFWPFFLSRGLFRFALCFLFFITEPVYVQIITLPLEPHCFVTSSLSLTRLLKRPVMLLFKFPDTRNTGSRRDCRSNIASAFPNQAHSLFSTPPPTAIEAKDEVQEQ